MVEGMTVDPELMGGAPCVRRLRIPVATVVAMAADGVTTAEIVADLPGLTAEDVAAALRYAAVQGADQRGSGMLGE